MPAGLWLVARRALLGRACETDPEWGALECGLLEWMLLVSGFAGCEFFPCPLGVLAKAVMGAASARTSTTTTGSDRIGNIQRFLGEIGGEL